MEKIIFHDNRRVANTKYGGEFFQVSVHNPTKDEPLQVTLSRYCVPGRVDSYRFHFVTYTTATSCQLPVQYGSEGCVPLAKAMKMVKEDLDKPQVVEMLIKLAHMRGSKPLAENLIAELHPKAKALRPMLRIIRARMKKRSAQLDAAEQKAKHE